MSIDFDTIEINLVLGNYYDHKHIQIGGKYVLVRTRVIKLWLICASTS